MEYRIVSGNATTLKKAKEDLMVAVTNAIQNGGMPQGGDRIDGNSAL
jgi:hypothetical protein